MRVAFYPVICKHVNETRVCVLFASIVVLIVHLVINCSVCMILRSVGMKNAETISAKTVFQRLQLCNVRSAWAYSARTRAQSCVELAKRQSHVRAATLSIVTTTPQKLMKNPILFYAGASKCNSSSHIYTPCLYCQQTWLKLSSLVYLDQKTIRNCGNKDYHAVQMIC